MSLKKVQIQVKVSYAGKWAVSVVYQLMSEEHVGSPTYSFLCLLSS